MQIPQELQHFPNATLIVTSDKVAAKFWLVGGDTLEELDAIAHPQEHTHDREDLLDTGNTDEERFHRYVHELTTHIAKLVQSHNVAELHLVMSSEIEHEVSSHLPQDVAAKIGKRVHADVMKESAVDVLKRVLHTFTG